MAVEHRKSGPITRRDAGTINNSRLVDAFERSAAGTVETVNADSIGSTYRFFQVPSTARVSQILLWADDIGATTVADFGLYRTTADGGAVVDADFFASAVVLNAGPLNAVDITHESGIFNIDDAEMALWQALNLPEDPKIFYDVAATLTAAADAAGTITLKGRWTA
jgi:hypothetical protein